MTEAHNPGTIVRGKVIGLKEKCLEVEGKHA
jgi:hypothetical protein